MSFESLIQATSNRLQIPQDILTLIELFYCCNGLNWGMYCFQHETLYNIASEKQYEHDSIQLGDGDAINSKIYGIFNHCKLPKCFKHYLSDKIQTSGDNNWSMVFHSNQEDVPYEDISLCHSDLISNGTCQYYSYRLQSLQPALRINFSRSPMVYSN